MLVKFKLPGARSGWILEIFSFFSLETTELPEQEKKTNMIYHGYLGIIQMMHGDNVQT